MLYTYPHYYNKFTCIADKCEDTCCAGWQIVIDDESIKRYMQINKEKDDPRIDWNEKVFKQCDGKRCAFLNDKNLCDMYIKWGKDALCDTCRKYPRHIEEFENVREYTLSISCPEVAKIILSLNDKVTFTEVEDDIEEVDEDFDILLFSVLEDMRKVIYGILQDRTIGISKRVQIVLELVGECQELIDNNDIFAINEVIDKYEKIGEIHKKNVANQYACSLIRFQRLYDMELLNDLWADMTDETATLVYSKGQKFYENIHKEFDKWLYKNMPDHNIIWEQILVYFISTYFCGAVYNGNAVGKVNMSVTSLTCIYEMLLTRWHKNRELSFEDIVFVVYMYSRELEHSDYNLEIMEKDEDRR